MYERWMPVAGYENEYRVSDLGRIRSLNRLGKDSRQLLGKVLSQGLSGKKTCSYYFVMLTDRKGNRRHKKTHRLVYEAFHGAIDPRKVIDHIDGDRLNNKLDNLQCITQRENIQKAITGNDATGELPCGVYQKSENSYFALKYIDGVQYNLGHHHIIEVLECYYKLATKTLLLNKNRWKDVAYEIACIYEDAEK